MKNKDFTENQEDSLKKFLRSSKECIGKKKISPSFLIYLISILPDENSGDIFTKSNKVLLRDTLPKKRRIYLDFLKKKSNEEELVN